MSGEPTQKKSNPIKSFITGGFGGVCNVITGHPLDTIKVRLQTMPRPAPGQPPMFTGTFNCAVQTIQKEGVRGLYKGISAPLTSIAPIFATCFAGYSLARRLQQKENQLKLTYPQVFVAGTFSGLLSTVIMTPGERIKCLLQIQQASGAERKYTGMLDCAQKLYKEGGIRSIYRGTLVTIARDLPSNGIYFVVYEFLMDFMKENTQITELMAAVIAGGTAGMSYWVTAMPPDVVKSRYQTVSGQTTALTVFRELLVQDGPFALYRGVAPVMIRAFPANAATFFGIELANMFFRNFVPNF